MVELPHNNIFCKIVEYGTLDWKYTQIGEENNLNQHIYLYAIQFLRIFLALLYAVFYLIVRSSELILWELISDFL